MIRLLQTRPLLCLCLSFLAVSLTAVYLAPLPKMLLSAAFFVFAILNLLLGKALFGRHPCRNTVTALLLCGFSAGCLSLFAFDYHAAFFSRASDREDTVTLEITETVYTSSYSARYFATVSDSALFNHDFRVLLDTDDTSVLPGDILRGTVVYHAPEEDADGFNERQYALTRRAFLTAQDTDLHYDGPQRRRSLAQWFSSLNASLCGILRSVTEEGELAQALLLGERSGLSDTMNRDFRRLGIYHLLSLSGAHLSILSATLEKCLLKLRIRKSLRSLLTIAAVLFFMALTGFSAALTRAGIMLILANLACLVRRNADYQTSLTLACAIIVACNPYAAMDLGLHLSFAASQSCYISSILGHRFTSLFTIKGNALPKQLRRVCNRLIRYLAGMVVFNTVITVNMLPLMWLYFGELSLLTLPANLLYMPLVTLLMYLALALLLLSPFRVFTPPLAAAVKALTLFIGETAEELSALPGVVISLNHWFAHIFLIPILALTILSFGIRRRQLERLMMVNLLLCLCFLASCGIAAAAERNHTYVEYVSRNENDGLLVKSAGRLLICEVSTGSSGFASQLVEHAADLRCTEIEVYMLTHYHNLQINALDRLTDRHILRSLLLPTPVTDTDQTVYNALIAMAADKGIKVTSVPREETEAIPFGSAALVTYPYAMVSRSSHPIISVGIFAENASLMYLGGSFNESNPQVLRHAEEADYLIFGGHSPIYKTAFDLPALSEAKTVYVSEYVINDLRELLPAQEMEVFVKENADRSADVLLPNSFPLSPEEVICLDP